MRKTLEQKEARRVAMITGSSYQACLQELRKRIAARWSTYDGPFQRFIETEAEDLVSGWNKK